MYSKFTSTEFQLHLTSTKSSERLILSVQIFVILAKL